MRILAISAGPNPDPAHSNSYLDRLPGEIAALGHEVTALHMVGLGRWFAPLHLTSTDGPVPMITVVNSAVYAGVPPGGGQGSAQPLRDVTPAPKLSALVTRLIGEIAPDVVHLQNLFGFPIQLTTLFRSARIPVVFTAHDYLPICATAHLFRPEGSVCELGRDALTCSRCCASSQSYALFRTVRTFEAKMRQLPPHAWRWRSLARVRNGLLHINRIARGWFASNRPYQRRFDLMREALHGFDCVHCISQLQARRLELAVGPLRQLSILPLVPPSVSRVGPVARERRPGEPLRFCILNVLPGRIDKGWDLLRSALGTLADQRSDFQVDWYANGSTTKWIRYRGHYEQAELDRIASENDFCLIPSVGLETLGFTGVEMLARGVPLIVSVRCGVAEWIRHRETGFIFDPASPSSLTQILHEILNTPALVRSVHAAQGQACLHMQTFTEHARAMSSLLENVARSAKKGDL